MAEISYARKYRPHNILDFMGVENKNKLMNRLKEDKNVPQTMLFYGPPGTGKTSLARLAAKEILCTDKVDGHSCGQCLTCLTIEDELINAEFGSSTLGITEINVGTEGGKDAIIELGDLVLQPPVYGYKYNIFILDECHMMTKVAQNALLKMLEELPKTSIIIMATTNPDKLLDTVRDRMQFRLQMRPATVDELVARMKYICQQEKIKTSEDALKTIARQCKRNPRQCITTLENVAKTYDHDATLSNVVKELNKVNIKIYEDYIKGAQGADPISAALEVCEYIEAEGLTYKAFLDGLIDFVTNSIKIKYGIGLEYETQESLMAARRLFNAYSISDMDCLLQIMEYAAKMLYTSESTEKLVILTTAMRISKVKLLEAGLQFVERDSARETEQGAEKAVQAIQAEQQSTVKALEVNDTMLATVFGSNVKEVASGDSLRVVNVSDEETTEREEKDNIITDGAATAISDEELLKMFSSN